MKIKRAGRNAIRLSIPAGTTCFNMPKYLVTGDANPAYSI
jgi:hypothetical protein